VGERGLTDGAGGGLGSWCGVGAGSLAGGDVEAGGAAEALQFEKAALLRDQIKELKRLVDGGKPADKPKPVSYRKSKKSGGGSRPGRKGGGRIEKPF